jgi:hypothetical protein
MRMRPRFSSSELVILLFLEALFLTYIVLDAIDMLYILGLFLLFVFFVIILIKLYRIYGRSPHIVQDLDDNRHYDRIDNTNDDDINQAGRQPSPEPPVFTSKFPANSNLLREFEPASVTILGSRRIRRLTTLANFLILHFGVRQF